MRTLVRALHLDMTLLGGLLMLASLGFVALYSASGESLDTVYRQGTRLALALLVLLFMAQIPARNLQRWSPWLYAAGIGMLVLVMLTGEMGKGAQRWLDLGFIRFQPSEIMKLAVPMMVAWYLADRTLPPRLFEVIVACVLAVIPVLLIARQPDLGTALLVGSAGLLVIFLAGLRWRILMGLGGLALVGAPILWHFMREYQRQRVLTLLNPESDPLGAGYHIIQSKIAIGSGGLYGKGWLNGTQSQLEFLPERSTDFIFAVYAEEFGLLGVLLMLTLYLVVILRGLHIAVRAQEAYDRLLAGSIALTFFVYLFVNTGMVTGLLPVVGVPLPLVSYGGTSMVTLMAAFGILMSINSHRRLLAR
ncbi:rod shape-determining protein RodA [Thioalkalivibrio denitrificans]|uniref:Peptidoglycan glycosyltransferase MrdB n=1 Tax=Thioalkalivibrio denitrificans TaxID=108003 RepID=A0A1V3NI76_9GAMM|nr:rod shape-determining protein RodA [Thioalkalivibrio denitrificans]OOG24760.1 rod shape-determining protein RodA [Thioalkalivibrio denitrificans]